jgi:hypothetical protein
MSATYNWAYRPGVINKYNFNIPVTADNVRPSNAVYMALFGNDITGNGSREYPYKTLTKALNIANNLYVIISSGTYREAAIITTYQQNLTIVADGNVTIDVAYNGSLINNNCHWSMMGLDSLAMD